MPGWILVATGLVVALAAAMVLSRLSGWFLPWLKGTLGLLVVLAGLFVMAVGWSTLQWQGVSPDRPLYRLSIESEGDQAWRVELRSEERLLRNQVVRGDLLEITGRLLVLDTPLGGTIPSHLYRTDSVRGHDSTARSLVEFRAEKPSRGRDWIDIWQWDRLLPLPLIRAELLYPLWVPIVEGAVFEVVLQGNQIVPVPANSAAEEALARRQ